MIIVDAHQDMALATLGYGRDYRESVADTRRREAGTGTPPVTIGLPEALASQVAVVFATLFVEHRRHSPEGFPRIDYSYVESEEAARKASTQLDFYERLADSHDRVRLLKVQADLDAVLASWQFTGPLPRDVNAAQTTLEQNISPMQGLAILMENADPIIEPRQFADWYERGVRIVGPAWKMTRYSGGNGEPGGLTSLGFELLEVMASYNALLDLSHMARQAAHESLDRYPGPIIASHSNPRRLLDSDRHLDDDTIMRVAERDGVVGVVLYNRFLNPGYFAGQPKRETTLATVVKVIDTICQMVGDAQHVGIGSDFDGGFGADKIPLELDHVGDLTKIAAALRGFGYDESDIEAIMGLNMLRKLREALPI